MKIYDPTYLGLNVAKSMGGELLVFCPYHFDSNPSAEYNLEKGLFYCFGCHESKTAKQLSEDLGGTMIAMREIPDEYRDKPGEDLNWVNLLKNPLALDNPYLKSRRVDNWSVIRYGIKETPDGIVFPLKDKFGNVRGVQVRHFEKKPKYKFYGERPAVWPMEILTEPSPAYQQNLFITEGIFGALRMQKVVDSVAIMGSTSIKSAVRLLHSHSTKTKYGIMDSDWAGQIAAGKFVLLGIPAIIRPASWKNEPDEFTKPELKIILENLEEFATYDVWDIINRSNDPAKIQQILEKFYRRI